MEFLVHEFSSTMSDIDSLNAAVTILVIAGLLTLFIPRARILHWLVTLTLLAVSFQFGFLKGGWPNVGLGILMLSIIPPLMALFLHWHFQGLRRESQRHTGDAPPSEPLDVFSVYRFLLRLER